MESMKPPSVYIVEKNTVLNSVVEVATAVPAFVGYTEIAMSGNVSLLNKPFRITSMAEFRAFFGGASTPLFSLSNAAAGETPTLVCGDKKMVVKQTGAPFTLYYQMLMFFGNGGSSCYIVSVGDYKAEAISADALKVGIDTLMKEQEPTLLLCPEAVRVKDKELCYSVQKAMLSHCGDKMRNRMAILDIFDGFKGREDSRDDVVKKFREKIGSSFLNFGVSYYPWLNTSVVQERELSFLNYDSEALKVLLNEELKTQPESKQSLIKEQIGKLGTKMDFIAQNILNKTLMQVSPIYSSVIKEGMRILNLLAPSASIAGAYTIADNTRGVWKDPANVLINLVISPTTSITNDEQADLNAPLDGKSINSLRTFTGEGVKVWGARTLDGDSLDWRYINVCRTMIMIEESIKNALCAYVFESNDASTWINIKTMIHNFLIGFWKRGGLAGVSFDEAFSVSVGLGETMTPEDILEGILRVKVLVAVKYPAYFIEIMFQQQMQKD